MSKKFLLTIAIAMLVVSVPTMAGEIVNVSMDVGAGFVDITATGFDSSTWHPGSIGQENQLVAMGGFVGTYTVSQGSYGSLNSYVNLNSYAGGADFVFVDYQNFDVLSANHINNVEGYLFAHASGSDDQVAMNLKSVGSMYVWSEATNPSSGPALQGNIIEKQVWTNTNGTPTTNLYLGVSTDGLATMSNTNIWGWTNGETGTSSTNYGGGTRTVSATGSGTLIQDGFGVNGFSYSNSYTMPGGGSFGGGVFSFNGGITGTYSMSAN